MDHKVLSFYALRSARGDVMKNAFFPKLLSDPYIYISIEHRFLGIDAWCGKSVELNVQEPKEIET